MRKCQVGFVVLALVLGVAGVWNVEGAKKKAEPVVELNEKGQKLEAKYAGELKSLQEQIKKALPRIDEKAEARFTEVYMAESSARARELNALRGQDRKPADHPSKAVYAEAKAALEIAVKNAEGPSQSMLADLKGFLASDKLDGKLAKCFILSHGTPRGLAAYAQQGRKQEKRIEELLKNDDLMFEIAVADGARGGKYGEAMAIYEAIQNASKKAKEGVLRKLALGTALEHAVPRKQNNPSAQTDVSPTVDPVKRYLHFEKAYLAGELDPGFKDLSVWDYRMVVNGDETEAALAWGREMLHCYRPDQIATSDYRWRYVKAVKTDVRYGSQYNKFDKPELQQFQNILMNGGVCGRRAFFGRFILRAFGIPTTARPQRGHAALTHWTPDGWVVCLGAGWTWGWTSFGQDRDFLAHTQARMTGEPFEQVRRAQMIGRALGEKKSFGFHAGPSGFWNGVALYTQKRIAEEAEAVALAAVGTDIGEANESKVKDVVEEVKISDEDKAIVIGKDGTITIPAVACTVGTNSPSKIVFMDSNLGGKQLHYNRTGKPNSFKYEVDVPKAGKYELTARIATPTGDQHLLISVNGAKEPVDVTMPMTLGLWGTTDPAVIKLAKGENVFECSRGGDNIRGLTIKDFTLKRL